MKTILFTLEYPPFFGGVASYYGNMADNWPSKNEFQVLDNSDDRLLRKDWPCLRWLPAAWQLYQVVNKEASTVLVGNILPLGTAAWLVKLITGTKYSLIMHGMDFAFAHKTTWKSLLAKIIIINCEQIICSNSYLAQLVREKYPSLKQRIHVVTPGVPAAILPPAESVKKYKEENGLTDKYIILSLGRLVKRKGFDMVIKAMGAISSSITNALYIIAGSGSDEDYLRSLVPADMSDKIRFLGKISDQDKAMLLSSCDVFAMPSRDIAGDFEGFGIVFLEAGLFQKPVIAGRSGGIADAVVDGMTGFLADPDDAGDIADKVIKLHHDPQLSDTMGRAARERALKDFAWPDLAKRIHDIITL